MYGTDIPVQECQLILHQPRLEEIAFIGEKVFFPGVQTLLLNKKMFVEDKVLLENTTNFQIFMMIMSEKEAKEKKDAVFQVLNLILPNYSATIVPETSLILMQKDNVENRAIIDNNNFDFLQEALKEIFCADSSPQDQQVFNPANDKAKEIAQKIMRGRKIVAEQKGETNTSVFTQYISILAVALNMSISELKKLTMFQLYDLMERYMLHTNWDIDLRQRLAGAKPEEHPDNWMKNIHP